MSRLFGSRAQVVLQDGERRGFLTRHENQYEVHPLLRQFLHLKLGEFDRDVVSQLASEMCRWEISERNWDEALQIANRFDLGALVFEIIERSLDEMLAKGRIASVEQWLRVAREHDAAAPTIAVAEMEICFRKHEWDEARSHAMRLVSDLPAGDPRLSRALHRVGQISQLDDRYEDALSFLRSARASAKTSHDLRAALWSEFLAISDQGERERAHEVLDELKALPDANADDLLRLTQAQLHLAARWGGIEAELRKQSGSLGLLEHSIDPVVRTGFLQTYGTAVLLTAKYDEALGIADRQLQEAETSGLEWVTSHGLQLRGGALWGLREFEAAASSLREAYRLSGLHAALHGQMNAAVLMARTHLARGAPDRALETTDFRTNRLPGPSMQGDFLAIRALAYACVGNRARALELADESERCTNHVEARVIRAFARAILPRSTATSRNLDLSALSHALDVAAETENFDGFVLSYRAEPAILVELRQAAGESAIACLDHIPPSDQRLAEGVGLMPKTPIGLASQELTPREQEVLGLIRNGLSNREIARTLWIAESTAKVHVRNVLKKLGVRTRTEAALAGTDD